MFFAVYGGIIWWFKKLSVDERKPEAIMPFEMIQVRLFSTLNIYMQKIMRILQFRLLHVT